MVKHAKTPDFGKNSTWEPVMRACGWMGKTGDEVDLERLMFAIILTLSVCSFCDPLLCNYDDCFQNVYCSYHCLVTSQQRLNDNRTTGTSSQVCKVDNSMAALPPNFKIYWLN